MKLQINVPVSGLDLASLLQGEDGLFLCQNRGQNYIAVAKASHSIAFGPTPIDRVIQEQVSTSLGPEPWADREQIEAVKQKAVLHTEIAQALFLR